MCVFSFHLDSGQMNTGRETGLGKFRICLELRCFRPLFGDLGINSAVGKIKEHN